MIYDELKTVLPFYNKIEKQTRYRKSCENQCNYRNVTPYDAIMPFQFRVKNDPAKITVIQKLEIFNSHNQLAFELPSSIHLIKRVLVNGYEYFTYDGKDRLMSTYQGVTSPLALCFGCLYFKITTTNGIFFSEIFCSEKNTDGFIKIEWGSNCNIDGIYFEGGYRDRIYVTDTYMKNSFEIIKDMVTNAAGFEMPAKIQMINNVSFSAVVPDYIRAAMHLMSISSDVTISTANRLYTTKAENIEIDESESESGCVSLINITFSQGDNTSLSSCCFN